MEGPLETGLESAGQADMMSSVHLETTDPPSWVPSGSQALWPGSPSSARALSLSLSFSPQSFTFQASKELSLDLLGFRPSSFF